MKTPRAAVTYYGEKSCIEDVLAIAHEIAQGVRPGVALNARKAEINPRRANRRTGIH